MSAGEETKSNNHVELSSRAEHDLRSLARQPEFPGIVNALKTRLTQSPLPENADIKHLAGHSPWLRMRVGTYRIVFRPLTASELATLRTRQFVANDQRGYLVERIVHRRELEEATARL